MGLEGVEFVIALEKEFALQIPDAAAAKMRTVRDTIDWIGAAVGARAAGPCRVRRAFLDVRAAMVEEMGLPRAALRPGARLDEVIPPDLPGERWAALRERVPAARTFLRRADWPGDALRWLAGNARPPRFRAARPAQTLGDLARDLAASQPVRPAPGEPWSREAVALTVRRVIRDEFGEIGFSDDARFVEDLRFD